MVNAQNLYVYEQTPYKARYSTWHYEALQFGSYIPISKNQLR